MQDTAFGLLAGGAALGLVASMWGKLKGFAWRLAGLLVQRVEIPTEPGHDALIAYLVAHFRRSRNYDKMYGASWEYQRDGRYGLVPYEVFGNRTLILWSGWFPFLFSNQVENKASSGKGSTDSSGSSSGGMKIHSTLIFVRGTLNVEQLLRDACAARNNISWAVEDEQTATKNRFCIHHVPERSGDDGEWNGSSDGLAWYQQGNYRLLAHTAEQLGKARTNNGAALDNLIFPQRVKDLIREIELWRKSKDWYLEKGIPWKRGWLLYGPPGTGKTALARAFAEDLNMPIYVYNLAEMSNHRPHQSVDGDADEYAVHRAHRRHRQRVPRPRERRPPAGHVLDDDAGEEGRRRRQDPGRPRPAAHLRLPAQLPRRRGTGGRHLHRHHDQRPDEDRPGAWGCRDNCPTARRSSSARGRAASIRPWN